MKEKSPVIHRQGPEHFFRELAKIIRDFPPLFKQIQEASAKDLLRGALVFSLNSSRGRKIFTLSSTPANLSYIYATDFCISISADGSLDFYFEGTERGKQGLFLITDIGIDGELKHPVKPLDYTSNLLLNIQRSVEGRIEGIELGWD